MILLRKTPFTSSGFVVGLRKNAKVHHPGRSCRASLEKFAGVILPSNIDAASESGHTLLKSWKLLSILC